MNTQRLSEIKRRYLRFNDGPDAHANDDDDVYVDDSSRSSMMGTISNVYQEAKERESVFVSLNNARKSYVEAIDREQTLASMTRRIEAGLPVAPELIEEFTSELRKVHTLDTRAAVEMFNSSSTHGLSNAQAVELLRIHGPNALPPSKEDPLWLKFMFAYVGGFALLFWFSCIFIFLSWKPFGTPPTDKYNLALAIVFIVIIVINGSFNFYQEVLSARILGSVKTMIPANCTVIRDGAPSEIPSSQLVLGDICILPCGSRIPSDVRIISQSGLKVDTSLLTGENMPVKLNVEPSPSSRSLLQSTNVAFMGCTVVEGEGVGVVFATGKENQLSRIAASVGGPTAETGLQKDLNRFVKILASMASLVVITVILEWAFYLQKEHEGFMSLGSMVANAISVFVAFIPEGLPMALQSGLAMISNRLCVNHNVLAKQLSIIETLGSVTVLASDKTGTLTMNKMTLQSIITGTQSIPIDDAASLKLIESVKLAALFCNQARVDRGVEPTGVVGGNGIDRALLQWMVMNMASVNEMQSKSTTKCDIPFSSATKLSAVVITDTSNYQSRVIVKGAPEYLLMKCNTFIDDDGSVQSITEAVLGRIRDNITEAAMQGLRVISVAQIVLPKDDFPSSYPFEVEPVPNFPLAHLSFVACCVVSDPPRKEVLPAIIRLREAGITVAMVTGDAPSTATAIARQVGIVSGSSYQFGDASAVTSSANAAASNSLTQPLLPNSSIERPKAAIVVDGKSIDGMSDADWSFVCIHKEIVFARVTPDHKLQIVKEFQRRGERVGMTGDGVNDSPALRRADIGIAMLSGSDVARDAADMVLLTDNFASIVHGVEEGRLIFDNLQKVIAYQISAGCYAELIPVLATFFVGMPQPLSSFLMIVISCVTDVYAGVALMEEAPEEGSMTKPPRKAQEEPLVSLSLIAYSYLWYGNMTSLAAFINYFTFMRNRGPLGEVPSPVPVDDDGHREFPAGYGVGQLVGAWNWALNDNALGADNNEAAIQGSAVFFVTLVVMQWGHLVSVRRKTPYFYDSFVNTRGGKGSLCQRFWAELLSSKPLKPIVYAILASAATAVVFTEVPVVQRSCGTASVSVKYWFQAMLFSIIGFVLNETRKWLTLRVATLRGQHGPHNFDLELEHGLQSAII